MSAILISVLVLGALGLVFGIFLMIANKVFEMPANPTRDAVRNALPGANCGGCGFAGCDALAEAIADWAVLLSLMRLPRFWGRRLCPIR